MKTIILEGPNGSGKSTLAEALVDDLKLNLIHAGGPSKDFNDAIKRALPELLCASSDNYLLDRCQPISFLVYQGISLNEIELAVMLGLTKVLADRCTIIYCTADGEPDFRFKPYYDDKLKKQVIDEQALIRSAYGKVFEILPHIPYDYKQEDCYVNLLKELES